MTEFLLIRHGQTDWNIQRRYQGQTDIPLNPTGLQQARALIPILENEHFDAIYSSDLSRAFQTAQIISTACGLAVTTDARLREINMGSWEGLSFDEVREKYADDFNRGAEDPEFTRSPGGESVADLSRRMAEAADDIAGRHAQGRVLLVSHGLAASALYCLASGISLKCVYEHIPDNTALLSIRWGTS